MSHPGAPTVSVVISTYQRPEACERALLSALEQSEPPLEVLVCDDGSADDTEARMRAWEARDPRVRYLRAPRNTGTPATTRNLGIQHARGDLIAFLDDDDEWLPGKLAAQLAAAAGGADAIAANALRSDGSLYFAGAPPTWRPTRLDLMRANPIITSTAVVAREPLLSVGGFPTDLRTRGLEDYVTWLALATRGLTFVILGEPLARYNDALGDRLSLERARIQVAVARLLWRHALRRPVALAGVNAALRHSLGVLHVLGDEALIGLRAKRARASGTVDRAPRS
jgi:glycosyltransferase involved in cell wall biosynthesis